PAFVLPNVAGGAEAAGDTLFDVSSLTMLVFWTTHCGECIRRLEICQELDDWGRPEGLTAIGVNFDDRPSAKIGILAGSATPRMLQLYDEGGFVAGLFGAGAHSFSVYLIDAAGDILAVGHEIPADSLAVLRPLLGRLLDEASGAPAPATARAPEHPGAAELLRDAARSRPERLRIQGVGRVRWMDIDTTGTGATGPNGEEVEPGATLRHRLELQLIATISSGLTAGGLLWLSNEGAAVLRSGPDYLSSPWGSAFVRAAGSAPLPAVGPSRYSLRAGYYDAAFSPLLLMRWDKDDSPISGGQKLQGCGVCGGEAGVAGFIRSESLEKLEPEYLFEGARGDLALGRFADLALLYARPQEHHPGETADCFLASSAVMRYREHLYGGRATGHAALPYTPDLLRVSGGALWVRDETDAWRCGTKLPSYEPSTTRLLGAELVVPLPGRSELAAEIAASRWTPQPAAGEGAAGADSAVTGRALRAAWKMDWLVAGGRLPRPLARSGALAGGMNIRLNAGYQRIGRDFYSPYSALSYEANIRLAEGATLPGLKGPRGSARLEWGPFGLGGFLKRLDPVDEEAAFGGAETPGGARRMASLWADLLLWPGGTLMGGWVRDDRDPLPSQRAFLNPEDHRSAIPAENRRTKVLGFEQELRPRCLLILEAQWVDGERAWTGAPPGLEEAPPEAYGSRTFRAMLDVEF
ncbi:MAG: hypothetical protein FJY75_04320, partial [Candidatus Eisenbacteria bacterium]|nr:hypothetical protein [Candidatus Eisenbacteria bacterium]